MRDGDKNTRFFYRKGESRRMRNWISKIKNSNGEWYEEDEGIAQIFLIYFKDLFSSIGSLDIDSALDAFDKRITNQIEFLSVSISLKKTSFWHFLKCTQLRP